MRQGILIKDVEAKMPFPTINFDFFDYIRISEGNLGNVAYLTDTTADVKHLRQPLLRIMKKITLSPIYLSLFILISLFAAICIMLTKKARAKEQVNDMKLRIILAKKVRIIMNYAEIIKLLTHTDNNRCETDEIPYINGN